MSKITLTKLGRMRKLDKTKAVFARFRGLKKRVPTNVAGYTPAIPRQEKIVTTQYGYRVQVFLSPGESCNPERRYRTAIKLGQKLRAMTIGK